MELVPPMCLKLLGYNQAASYGFGGDAHKEQNRGKPGLDQAKWT
jgi:hypothetical protein